MEWLITLAPIALIVLGCGAMHFFMMRGMHGHAGHGGAPDVHGGPATGAGDEERLRQLESELASSRDQVAASRRGANGPDKALATGRRPRS